MLYLGTVCRVCSCREQNIISPRSLHYFVIISQKSQDNFQYLRLFARFFIRVLRKYHNLIVVLYIYILIEKIKRFEYYISN